MAKQSVTVRVDRELAEGEALVSEADLRYWISTAMTGTSDTPSSAAMNSPAHQQPIEGPAEPQLAQNLFLSSGTTPATECESNESGPHSTLGRTSFESIVSRNGINYCPGKATPTANETTTTTISRL